MAIKTLYIRLYKPADGEFGWQDMLRKNSDLIDAEANRIAKKADPEHKSDGKHGNINADSIKVAGVDVGAITAGVGTSVAALAINDSGKNWVINALANTVVTYLSSGVETSGPVVSNTATQIVLANGSPAPDAGTTYAVYGVGHGIKAAEKGAPGGVATLDINGNVVQSSAGSQRINDIGTPATQGFGVGICPSPPSGMTELSGTRDSSSNNYGNYQYWDGSIMVWIPAFYYTYGNGTNRALNTVDIKPISTYTDEAAANTAGYALHRAFYDGGAVQQGVFVDKYQCSNNGGIASSLKDGNPLSSGSAHNPFSLVGAANAYYGAIGAAKSRGAAFFCNSRFIFSALAMLSLAHGQAATAATWCAWYDSAGITNFPKGCNNNALGDADDAAIAYVSDGYLTAGKTGSANLFARTTHNGQNCGVADLNGNMWEINPGLTSDATNFYILNTSVSMQSVTGGNTLGTDLWGTAGMFAKYASLGTTFGSLAGLSTIKRIGSASQVISDLLSGNEWNAAGAGVPLAAGVGGTNAFGNDGLWDYKPSELCPIAGGYWSYGGAAGVWALGLAGVRATSSNAVGFRAALYL